MSQAWNAFAGDEEIPRRLAVALEARVASLGPEDRARGDEAAGRAVPRVPIGPPPARG